ncbi:MAG: hypothetical protein AAGA96_15840 [Verrucomicrobiota bacterium]
MSGELSSNGTMQRRGFLKAAALSISTVTSSSYAEREKGCGLAMGTYGMSSLSLEDSVRLIGETGFDALELTVFPGTPGHPSVAFDTAEKRARFQGWLEDHELRWTAVMADFRPEADERKHREQLLELALLVEMLYKLAPSNPPIIQTILGGKEWLESRNLFRDRLANWNQVLADLKGYVAIKPHRNHAMSSPKHAKWLLDQLGNPRRLSMVFDYSHYVYGELPMTVDEAVNVSLPMTSYVAVKDAVKREGKVRYALPGTTDSWDQSDVIGELYWGGYRGDFCCEVSAQVWREPNYDAVEATQVSYRNMVEAFERGGVPRA